MNLDRKGLSLCFGIPGVVAPIPTHAPFSFVHLKRARNQSIFYLKSRAADIKHNLTYPGIPYAKVRIVRAPNVKSVRGCIDAAYIWPNTPGLGTSSAVSNISANDALVNGFLVVGRTLSNPVQVWPHLTPTVWS